MTLHTIDPDAPVAEQAVMVARACEDTGFFRLPVSAVGHPIADAAWDAAREFFALPLEDKLRVGFPEPGYPYGYSPYRYEALARSLDDEAALAPDPKESFSVGPDCGPTPPTASEWVRSPSLWPERPAGLRAAWTAYYRALAELSERLLSVMAVALDLPADHFAPMVDRPISALRALHYPAARGESDGAVRAGAHSDYGTLTILRTDDVPGLEIRRADGSWEPVEPKPDEFVVNLGDSIARWTNDRWRSTVHRVVDIDGRPRHSMAFFHMANWDAVIECLPNCRAPGRPPRYEPVEAGPWLMERFRAAIG